MADSSSWEYEPRAELKPKHGWGNEWAGFVEKRGGETVGKCPSDMTTDQAEELLNEGIEWTSSRSDHADDWPERIYVVHEGVVYRATPTRRGESYHGFPAQRRVPRRLKEKLLARARELDCETEVKRWMRKHMGMKNL